MPVEPLKIEEDKDILEYKILRAESFDYDDLLAAIRKGEAQEMIDKRAPPNATHYSFLTGSSDDLPSIDYDYGSPKGVRRTCAINYWKKKVA